MERLNAPEIYALYLHHTHSEFFQALFQSLLLSLSLSQSLPLSLSQSLSLSLSLLMFAPCVTVLVAVAEGWEGAPDVEA